MTVLSLLNLNPSSSYTYEAIAIIFLGLGMGVGMPIINLVVQNEFEQKDIGTATSSSQLFRGLGSTIGIAVFSMLLTASLTTNVGEMTNSKYIQTLKQNPTASKIGDLNDTDTLLTINMPDIKRKLLNLPILLLLKFRNRFKLPSRKNLNQNKMNIHQLLQKNSATVCMKYFHGDL